MTVLARLEQLQKDQEDIKDGLKKRKDSGKVRFCYLRKNH